MLVVTDAWTSAAVGW